jgi:hypothetical protein
MNLYHCRIALHREARALVFAKALEEWMELLQSRQTIRAWRLLRTKLHFTAEEGFDFLLEVEVDDLSQLDRAFRLVGQHADEVGETYTRMHGMIAESRVSLYRPFPDPERAERMALI